MRAIVRRAVVVAVLVACTATPLSAQDRDPRVTRGERLFTAQGCYGCHQVGKFGTPIGPDLSRIGAKYPAAHFRQWLRDPAEVRATAHMPKLELSAEEVELLAAYLSSLK